MCRGMGPIRDGTSGRRLSATAVTRGVSSCDNRHTWMTCIFVKRKALTKLDPLTLYAIRISLLTPPEAARARPLYPEKSQHVSLFKAAPIYLDSVSTLA